MSYHLEFGTHGFGSHMPGANDGFRRFNLSPHFGELQRPDQRVDLKRSREPAQQNPVWAEGMPS
jgi:hypothetical protein